MPHAYSVRIDILTIRVQLRANGRILAKLCLSFAAHNVSDAALRAFFRLWINNFCNSVNHKLKYSISPLEYKDKHYFFGALFVTEHYL